jgi:NADH-quinone oxidoreductase subunit J
MPRTKPPELTFQQHIPDFLVRVHGHGVLEQTDITDTATHEGCFIALEKNGVIDSLSFRRVWKVRHGSWVWRRANALAQPLFFYYFSAGAIVSAILTVGLRSPIYCTVALLSALLHVAGLFILLHAEFVFAIQVIIYAGAVLVLYLFVLMLLSIKSRETFVHRLSWVAGFFSVVILAEILLVLLQNPMADLPNPVAVPSALGNTETIGIALFTDYLLQFEMVGIILLGGAIGALILAKPAPPPAVPSPPVPQTAPAPQTAPNPKGDAQADA